MSAPKITVAIATFNSLRTLRQVLEALQRQEGFKPKDLEILLIDGGSTDGTPTVGTLYDCRVIPNPRTEPVYAKFLALTAAKAPLLVYLDHDEVLLNPDSLFNRMTLLQQNSDLHVAVPSGYQNPNGCAAINYYLNDYGEPFSYFVYGLSKSYEHFLPEMRKLYPVERETKQAVVFNFANVRDLPILELCAGGVMIDRDYFLEKLKKELEKPANIPHLFYLLRAHSPLVALTKKDPLDHHSAESFSSYLNKIRWRVKNNIYHRAKMGESGFSGRMKFSARARRRRLLFLPYAFSFVWPLFDSLRLTLKNRRFIYLLHLPLTLFTAWLIVKHGFLWILGNRPQLRSYDEAKEIDPKVAP